MGMLVLTRHRGEDIVVDGPAVIRLVDIMGGGKVRLGIFAAKEVLVDRREVYEDRCADAGIDPEVPLPELSAEAAAFRARNAGGAT